MQHQKVISPVTLTDLIEKQRYGVEYQPIIDITNHDIFAYECLSRFFDSQNQPIRPDTVYASLHESPLSLFQVEYQQKKLQLSNAPKNENIFVNLDQDSYFAIEDTANSNPFLRLFNSYQQGELTVELIENSGLSDAIMSLSMIDILANSDISTAMDDVCNPDSMVSTSVLERVNYIKLDKYVLVNKKNSTFLHLVQSLIAYAQATGKRVVLEGVETAEDLAFAKQLNCDFVQGYLFRDKFIVHR